MSFILCERSGVRYLRSDKINLPHAFSTRLGGVSEAEHLRSLNFAPKQGDTEENIRENYRRFMAAAGLSGDMPARAVQIHSNTVVYADSARDYPDCDGLFTDRSSVALSVRGADCTPILLCDERRGLAAAVHAGWRGSAVDIVGEAVGRMRSLGAETRDIVAAIGPHIGACCYEVKEDFREAIIRIFGERDAGRFVLNTEDIPSDERELALGEPHTVEPVGVYRASLTALNVYLLLRAGVRLENIDTAPSERFCTCCHPELFYSHRYGKGRRGTMCAAIELD